MALNGIDVSRYQSTTPSLVGLDFLIARAAYGDAADPTFAMHIGKAKRAGLVTGAYLFGRAGAIVSLAAQAAELVAVVRAVGGVDLVFVDLERDGSNASMTAAEARIVADLAGAELGQPIGLYHSSSGFPAWSGPRWVADYRPIAEPPVPWDIWQWTSFVDGVHLDRNRYRGTADQLRALGRGEEGIVSEWTAYRAVGEDWHPSDRGADGNDAPARLVPDRGAAIAYRFPAGTIIRTIGEFVRDGQAWRITRLGNGATAFLIRGDLEPLVAGGDPTVDAGLRAYIARATIGTSSTLKAAALKAIDAARAAVDGL